MSEKKLKDTEFKKVVVTYRDPDNESTAVKVGGNNVIIDGKRVLKQYTVEVGKEVELPVPFIEDLKKRVEMRKKGDDFIEFPTLLVEEV
jgi:hypothetical protein